MRATALREIYRSTRPGKHFGIKSGHSGRVITLTTVAKSGERLDGVESKAEMHSRLDNVQQMPILGNSVGHIIMA